MGLDRAGRTFWDDAGELGDAKLDAGDALGCFGMLWDARDARDARGAGEVG